MKVQLLVRSYSQMMGLSRYSESLTQALTDLGMNYSLQIPTYPFLLRIAQKFLTPLGFDLQSFFTTFPVAADLDRDALIHLTTQQMGTLMWFKPRLHPVVITVHDIVPFLVRNDPDQTTFLHPMEFWFDNLAMKGLQRADAIISDSYFTKQTLIDRLKIPADRIHVVHLAIEHKTFFPKEIPDGFKERYQLEDRKSYILYVGSENPRKNLHRLLDAVSQIREQIPGIQLIKIGSTLYGPQAEKLRNHIESLDLVDSVLFIDHVSDQDLAMFYNFADLFVFPSIYEGFGLPPLEAMACGTPVVSSNAASLPDVVGDAALLVDPFDVDAIAAAMRRVLEDAGLAQSLREKGLAHAQAFTWELTAQQTIAVYQSVLNG